jgi:hypothetical protein
MQAMGPITGFGWSGCATYAMPWDGRSGVWKTPEVLDPPDPSSSL